MPPHRGHLSLVETALPQVDHLSILVCSLKRDPIPGILRFRWMRELVPQAQVLHVTDENPSQPYEHPRFWEIWIETMRRALPASPDVVFSGEPYGRELARQLGARHVFMDRTGSPFAISGTEIRARPLAHWDFLPPVVRPYFAKRIVVTGSESTGKTTLARQLAAHYQTVWVPEFARGYLDTKSAPLEPSDIEPIARGQLASEEKIARNANRFLILDTDLVSTLVYASHYYGQCPDWVREAALAKPADLYLLADIDVPWVADPQRDRPHRREHMHHLFEEALRETGARTVMLRGSWEVRLKDACTAADPLWEDAGP